jgi:hypothetical protein
MTAESAAPCRHAGAPPPAVIEKVSALITSLGAHEDLLRMHGLSVEEFEAALLPSIQALRGSDSASSSERKRFLIQIFEAMEEAGIITGFSPPRYGQDTVYRLVVPDFGDVAIIQKGCPDGVHSAERWTRPEWARETYLWWLCSSLAAEPGEHIVKGVNRLKRRFFSAAPDWIDGIIFHNALCGTAYRVCPKAALSIDLDGKLVPPPCIYVTGDRDLSADEWNWNCGAQRVFPAKLLALFGIAPSVAATYTGGIGFQRRGVESRAAVCSRYGPARSTSFRN